MNAYTVDWVEDAEQALASIYLQAYDKAAVTKAQARIDALLAT